MGKLRKPVVAGQFYPNNRDELEQMISSWRTKTDLSAQSEGATKGLVLPHAGYMYSGMVAAQTVLSSRLRNHLIVLGPNHTGLGEQFSVMAEGIWPTPFGDVKINESLANAIIDHSKRLRADTTAHQFEHSIEVLLPFLKYVQQDFSFVPIVVAQATPRDYQSVAQDILAAIKALKLVDSVSVIASSDMTHYEPQKSAEKKDRCAIDAILRLDAEGLLDCVDKEKISMCGVVPVCIMLKIVKELGVTRPSLIRYMTSAETTGDYQSVVGYAGIKIE